MPVVHGMFGLAECAEQVTRNEDHPKQQHALIKPASHSLTERGRLKEVAVGFWFALRMGLVGLG